MDALNTLSAAGVTLRADGDTLKASGRLTDEHRRLIREHRAELIEQLKAANDPGSVSNRWKVSPPDVPPFEISTWPACTLAEVQATNPGAVVEPVSRPTGGHLPHADVEIIKAVCRNWEATSDEIRDAIAEASANPTLMDGWRRETRALSLDITPCPKPSVSQAGQALEVDIGVDMDDRITCLECRLLKPGNLCGSPAWAPRYHPPARPHRCVEFQPKPGATDPRPGAQRWPQLEGGRP